MSISTTLISLVGYGFVDDVDLLQTCNDKKQLIKKAEAGLKVWEGSLRTTGGALSTEKSFWYDIAFTFNSNCWNYKTNKNLPGTISKKNNNKETKLKREMFSKEKETLGVYFSPDVSHEKEIEKVSEKLHILKIGYKQEEFQKLTQ